MIRWAFCWSAVNGTPTHFPFFQAAIFFFANGSSLLKQMSHCNSPFDLMIVAYPVALFKRNRVL